MSALLPWPRYTVLLLLVAGLLLTACADPNDADPSSGHGKDDLRGTVTVVAAASLTEAFTRLAADFEQANPGTTAVVSFGPSSSLAESIVQGAPADVFAAADEASMRRVLEAEAAEESVVFARNQLQIAVPAGNPAGVTGLDDFADDDLLIAICAEEVPCGRAAGAAFDAAEVTPSPDTYGRDVKAVLTAVRTGEVDAGLVYRTDVAADDRVEGIGFPESAVATNDYHLAVLANANGAAARAFADFVRSAAGQQVLTDAGFGAP